MNLLSPEWTAILYLIAAVCFILALKGLGSPKSARRGNLIGAFGALLAMVVVFLSMKLDNLLWILIVIAVGTIIAVPASRAVKMTQMPQLVALFNGVGGGAAGLVALLELAHSDNIAAFIAVAFTVLVGGVAFSGSVVTFLKLQELMPTRPIVLPAHAALIILVLLVGLAAAAVIILDDAVLATWGLEGMKDAAAIVGLASGLVLGVLLVLPVGGADVPIVISLLNAGTGLAVAASGLVLGNTLLLVAGTLVGASGSILTHEMAKAMGRSVTGILFGAFKGGSTAGSTAVSDRPVKSGSPDDVAILLGYAQRVIVVPGYGLAVAQAQHTMAELAETLEGKGIEVVFGIHPVAGRMPGHMNVLLAEANVSYDVLQEMDEVNPKFKTTDVVLVVGANDVVNPAAKSSPGSPIYGMPILEVSSAKQVIFLKRSMRPGFAGIENELLFEPTTTLLFGDAKESLTKVLGAVKAL
ncbi:NAD(P)(+) transhydrogenase (Re/Si-specific) subunit beta [Salinibacterium sp. SYSU T00001]|uniref:NAD(P)(+) transhydrogenase (Re/Si-specific) subunit beta n=1 Tax=Homoserinimonas sedimenticola TaxID=2986805 RepID=UPI002235DEC8|nr:NAD(P)(+) transhydrogenase (Re/Si-specific) subunit beta [Salinibacterium sedimenticola]MCW4385434.1 NAD(P)(+) transhydrogenase (Re/Si-specific) subunit beta [Salinibacterium sedimenticola]